MSLLKVCALAALLVLWWPEPAAADCPRDPRVTAWVNKLRVIVETGGDDLRGGDDNVYLALKVNRPGGSDWLTLTGRGGLNRFVRWPDWSSKTEYVTVADAAGCPVPLGVISQVRLTTRFGGGVSGDNWNMRSIHIDWLTDTLLTGVLLDVPRGHTRDSVVFRFTGDRPTWEHDTARAALITR